MESSVLIFGDLIKDGLKISSLVVAITMAILRFRIIINPRHCAWVELNHRQAGYCIIKKDMLHSMIWAMVGFYRKQRQENLKEDLSTANSPIWKNMVEEEEISCIILSIAQLFLLEKEKVFGCRKMQVPLGI